MSDLRLQLMVEFLVGEGGSAADSVADIQRLVVVGNSLAPVAVSEVKATIAETSSKSVS